MPRDICIVTDSYHKKGGIERYNVELADHLVKSGYRVSVVARNVDYPTANLFRIMRVESSASYAPLRMIMSGIAASKQARDFKKEFPGAIIIASGLFCAFSDVYIAHSVHRRSISLTNAMSAKEDRSPRGMIHRVLRWFAPPNVVANIFEWASVKYATNKIIAVSEKTKKEILGIYHIPENKITVVYNGVNMEEFISRAEVRQNIRRDNGFSDDDFLLITSANEFKRKGLKYIIMALALINDSKVKLIVAGKDNPDQYQRLAERRGVDKRAFFIGSRSDLAAWFAASDIFVFPTLDDAFGLVALEAMAAGLPVVASNAKFMGAAEIMRDGEDALLLKDPTSSEEIAEKIHLLMSDAKLRKSLSENAQQTASRYSWDKVTQRVVGAVISRGDPKG